MTTNFIINCYFLSILRHFMSFIFRLITFEILSFLSALGCDKCRLITRDLYTLEKIVRNFSNHRLSQAIYVIRNWIVGILSAMHGILCNGFHVPHLAYQGILLQTRLIRLVTGNRGTEREREKLIHIEGTRELLSHICNVEQAKQTTMYPRINVVL